MMTLWLILETGMLHSLIGCYATKSFMPCLAPAIGCFLLFIALWPTGKTMISRVGSSDDPGLYVEPR